MGQLKHDGRATQGGFFTAPGGQAIVFGDMYRLNGWTHIAMSAIGASDTVRAYDGEIAPDRVWYVKLPAGATPAVGDPLYWTAGTGFKRGDTDLTTTATGAVVAKVEEAKDANGYAAVRLVNIA